MLTSITGTLIAVQISSGTGTTATGMELNIDFTRAVSLMQNRYLDDMNWRAQSLTLYNNRGGDPAMTVSLTPPGPIRVYQPKHYGAVVLTIDDIFPGTRGNPFEAGGALEKGGLGRLLWLLNRHPKLCITLFVTPDWRETTPVPRNPLRHVPWVRDRLYLAPILSKGSMDLRRYPEFVSFLNAMPRTELALHGLHHIHRGRQIAVEFQRQDNAGCTAMMREAITIFEESGMRWSRGLQPPGWSFPSALHQACIKVGVNWVASGRDLRSPIEPEATMAEGFGLENASLIYPERTIHGLTHFSTNFQATSPPERAFQILDAGGILAVKAHITKCVPGHIHADGVNRLYMNYLDRLFNDIEDRYGDTVAWTTMGAITEDIALMNSSAPFQFPSDCVANSEAKQASVGKG